ncbi:T9SS type A sorting domain-containing protein [Tamlana sp. 2201CG12-4]|uniref:T9SS type A sorting domain-containing protein n=1 Tax=Tamlana sp. 2201CG12-4 TaxID=3112582 RepID=UPI002DBAC9FB|nr:T9SS type A sorting domain-containing protein [Tamlana sp. 2201CG12-4]MEC3908589.1 T9SS type A sorting domain-containing protein [Tamlana sp. 2201CG12-4]
MFYRLLIVIVFTINFSFSQDLYVADDSYLYSRDVVVFVNDDIRLDTSTSNLYLRGNAQLLQNTDSKNSDEGKLSIYQNQTTGIYEYNYWCSPVGVPINGTVQSNVYFNGSNVWDPIDGSDPTNINSSAYTFTPSYNGTATALSNYWMFTYIDAEGYNDWNQIFDTGTVNPGYGFTLKGSPNTNNILDFRGRPNNGEITISCTFDGTDNQPNSGTLDKVNTLTGNPYPSALDLKLFFANSTDNQNNLSGHILFWEQKETNSHRIANYEGGYGVYTPGDLGNLSDNGTYASAPFKNYNTDGSTIGNTTGNTTDFSANNSRRYAAVGQGFMIQSEGTGGNITFDNSMRLYLAEDSSPTGNGSIFAKSNKSKNGKTKVIAMSHNGVDYDNIINNPNIIPEIRIHTRINNAFYKENVIAFRENTPDNSTYNRFYDALSFNELNSDSYLVSSAQALVIKSINYDENTKVPLGFKTDQDQTEFNVKINELKNIPDHINIYLYDKVENKYTDIKNGAFDITLDSGTYNDRFEISFIKDNTLNVENTPLNAFRVFQNNRASKLTIINENRLSIKSFTLYDVSGKQIVNQTLNSSKRKYHYPTESISEGVYIAKIQTSDLTIFSKKIIILNRK